jgi:hypothetical protein
MVKYPGVGVGMGQGNGKGIVILDNPFCLKDGIGAVELRGKVSWYVEKLAVYFDLPH